MSKIGKEKMMLMQTNVAFVAMICSELAMLKSLSIPKQFVLYIFNSMILMICFFRQSLDGVLDLKILFESAFDNFTVVIEITIYTALAVKFFSMI